VIIDGNRVGFLASHWYATNVPIADRVFTEHQEKLRNEADAAKPKTRKGKKR
jgi:hypothetical protein